MTTNEEHRSRKRNTSEIDSTVSSKKSQLMWKNINAENLNLSYVSNFLSDRESYDLFLRLEQEITYFSGDLAKVRVFGKWHNLPRQQAAFGDFGLKYTFSGCTVPAQLWTPALTDIKTLLESYIPHKFNFCLVNRYRNGSDNMGEHRDDEQELDSQTPIASVSLGQHRDFIFRHKDSRGKTAFRNIDKIKLVLGNGSLLLMNSPTNKYWYHSLPQRKKLPGVRINLTFRQIICKDS